MGLKQTEAGYFRIGHVTLQIPPSDISTNKASDDEEIFPLRAKFAMHRKTGHSRWDVTVHWRALYQDNDISQWEDLQTVLAIFKAAPFVEVENAHLRQILMVDPDSGTEQDARMAFALRQLKIDTIPDIPQGLDVTLTMSWFNYLPFSYNFGYLGTSGDEADSYQSGDFQLYIETWKRENLEAAPNPFGSRTDLAEKYGYPDMAPWAEQTSGTTSFTWRTYQAIAREDNSADHAGPSWGGADSGSAGTPPSTAADPNAAPPTRPRGNTGTKSPMSARTAPADIKAIIVDTAKSLGVDCNLCLAVSQRESGFNPNAKNPESSATGLFQLLAGTAKKWGVKNVRDAQENATGGIKYIRYLLKRYHGNTNMALTGFAAGEGNVDRLGLNGSWDKYPWIPGWLDDIGNIYAQLSGQSGTAPQTTFANASAFKPQPLPATTKTPVAQMKATGVPQEVIDKTSSYINDGWSLDHFTERTIFLYKEHIFSVMDEEHGDGPNVEGLYQVMTSVIFVNNLSAIPLRSYQYPTYQFTGASGTMIVIGLMSNGVVTGDLEPVHEGLAELSGMCSSLQSQYHRLQGEWRSVSSIHRMQSVIVENQVLNLLGIRGAIVRGLNTETIPDSSNLSQVSLNLAQYENVFEEIEPFKVKGSGQAYSAILTGLTKGDALDKLVNNNPNSVYEPLKKYRDLRNANNPEQLLRMLKDTTYASPPQPMPVPLDQDQLVVLKTLTQTVFQAGVPATTAGYGFGGSQSIADRTWATENPVVAKRIQSGNFSYNDYVLLMSDPLVQKQASAVTLRDQVNSAIASATPKDQPLPMDKLYDQTLDYLATKDLSTMRAVEELENDPKVKSQMKAAGQNGGPGLDPDNKGHGAYADLGLKTIDLGGRDFNPAYYFVDSGKKHQLDTEKQLATAVQTSIACWNTFQKKTGSSNIGASATVAPGAKVDGTMDGTEAGNSKGVFDPTSTLQAILAKTSIPYLSMSRAFPTFKLFIMDECNSGPFVMFDNFYSYGSVLNIEVTKSIDPTKDVAVVTLTNFANLLSHRLFDGTAAGKREKSLENMQEIPENSNGDASQGGVQAKANATKNWLGVPETVEEKGPSRRHGLDLSKGFNKSTPAPLQYYALQTGAKVQIRMGFSNNPDKLWPVFNGKVTQIEGEEVMQVVCQGYAIELTDPAPETLAHDGYLTLNTGANMFMGVAVGLVHGVETVLSGPSNWSRLWGDLSGGFGVGAAYGGYAWMGDSGTADSVIECVLKTSRALHFGHWQIDPARNSSQFVKGFGWAELASKAAGALGMSKTSTLLNSLRDRRGENVMINRSLNWDGSNGDARMIRPWNFEQPLGLTPAQYHVPNDPSITPWRIIRDISRRYSEYILAVRPYGFPVGADATLVFANPNDVYTSAPSIGDSLELELICDGDDSKFKEWWATGEGRKHFLNMASEPGGGSFLSKLVINSALLLQPSGSVSISGPQIAEQLAVQIDNGLAKAFSKIMGTYMTLSHSGQFLLGFAGPLLEPKAHAIRLQREVQKLIQEFAYYKQLMQTRAEGGRVTDPCPGDRIQPVRRWHLVSKDVIVSNGLRLNDQVYNAARVNRSILKANGNIPDYYTRILDCDRMIIEPVKNAQVSGLELQYQQSFLREELGKMYRGELVLAGMPEIEPNDVLILSDPSTGMVGPVEVETVVHSFSSETGFITIVTPRALVILNDFLSAGLGAALVNFTMSLPREVSGLWKDLQGNQAEAVATVGTAVVAAAATKAAVGTTASAAAAVGFTAPVSIPVLTVVAVAAVAASLVMLSDDRRKNTPLFVAPIHRFGRPWVGGLQGWQLGDMHTLYTNKFNQMWDFEVAPTIEGFKILHQIKDSL